MMHASSLQWVTLVCVAGLLSACATRYVERNPSLESSADHFGDVVVSESSDALKASPLTCLGILPLTPSHHDVMPTEPVRRALHAHLAPTGIRLVPLQRLDAVFQADLPPESQWRTIAASSGCETLMVGEVTERQSRFWGVYSDVRVGAHVKIIHVGSGQILWQGRHTAVARDGGIPIGIISLVAGAVSAGLNLRDEQTSRVTHDLARRLVLAIPNLTYRQEDVVASTPSVLAVSPVSQSAHAMIAALEHLPPEQISAQLILELQGPRWSAPADRLIVAESLIRYDDAHAMGFLEAGGARLRLNEPEIALQLATHAIQRDPTNPDTHFLAGRAYLHMHQPAEATRPLIQAVSKAHPTGLYFNALGLAYNQLGAYPMAVAALTKALALDPDNGFALLQAAVAYVGNDDHPSAAHMLRRGMVVGLANDDPVLATRSLQLLKSLNLSTLLSAEDLDVLEHKIRPRNPA